MKPLIFSLSLLVLLFVAWPVQADDPIVGEIRLWAGEFDDVPDGWVLCQGQGISNDTYSELYDVIGNLYGGAPGDGWVYVPDLMGKVPVGRDGIIAGPFGTLGQTGGEISHTLTINEMPSHRHGYTNQSGENGYIYSRDTISGLFATLPTGIYFSPSYNTSYVGNGQPYNNLQPYIALNYIIFTGVYQNPTPTPTATVTSIPGATGPLTGTITGSLVISQALPSYAFTQTLTTGNEFVYFRSASYGEIIAGSGALLLFLGVIFWFVARSTRRSSGD